MIGCIPSIVDCVVVVNVKACLYGVYFGRKDVSYATCCVVCSYSFTENCLLLNALEIECLLCVLRITSECSILIVCY